MGRKLQWSLVLALIVLLSSAAFETIASAMPGQTGTARLTPHQEKIAPDHDKRELARTIGILESKTGIHRLPRQTKEKLAAMNEKEFMLVRKLCDRIAGSGDTPGTDIALLLAAALIVLS
jgi:hypothetical protein